VWIARSPSFRGEPHIQIGVEFNHKKT
jgi:hypothetical protein